MKTCEEHSNSLAKCQEENENLCTWHEYVVGLKQRSICSQWSDNDVISSLLISLSFCPSFQNSKV